MAEKPLTAPMSAASPSSSGRRALVWGAAAAAGLAGAGVAWWRFQPNGSSSEASAALDAFWALSLDTPDGVPMPMQAFRGSPLVVNFWATWCPPCVEEMPLLDSFYRENKSKSWQVLGVAVDQPSAVRRFMQKTPVSYPIGMAGMGGTELSKSLGNLAGGLPFTVVVHPNGNVMHRKIGQVTPQNLAEWVGGI
ncbi:MAG: TlpA family protein disulfide reductase [Burkholderiaceae bacterium]|nr:TlpA family protein disulfide reductase [Burkholderiaceae bacterium]MBP6617039.1 TlpA family protein disulfide reductase [Burkholderiaceae bacterium]MBP8150960.1 TlpA family protein disulfide reductase [Xylophilus sp.]MBP8230587.1 TlpA family protein disulfide reductase [Xylophilus sp.]